MSNRTRIVTDEELEKALDFLRDGAAEIGAAKADMVRASHMVRVVKALVMKRFNDMPVNASEREALASDEYRNALEEDATAAGEYEKLRALREAAAMKIEAWRTEQASWRAMKI
jgi:hypothetical protein